LTIAKNDFFEVYDHICKYIAAGFGGRVVTAKM
jgi:hypothetical protein